MAESFLKKTLAQVFSCKFCEIYKNTFFTEHLRTTASVYHILGLNQLVAWFASAAHPNLGFKNLTLLGQKM